MLRAVLIGTICAACAWTADPSLETTLAKMDQASAKFAGLTADLRRVAHTAVINEDSVDSGTVTMKRPRPRDIRMLYDTKLPDPKQYAFDGRKGEIYLPKVQTVQEYDLGKYRGLLDQFLLLGFGSSSKELENAYTITYGGAETIGGERTTRLELIPKSQEMLAHLKRVDLWIADTTGVPVQQKFYMPGGDYQLATYSNTKINPTIPDSAVKLNLPKGVKREYPGK
ncbi:MAG: hypothetical protein C5B51_17660 [Terriglobia bacterium]|nr:MAG: hypothetical protein C5B51_17660 [Terriglobia bacterium]